MNDYLLFYLIVAWFSGFFIWADIFENSNRKNFHVFSLYLEYILLILITPIVIPTRLIIKILQ